MKKRTMSMALCLCMALSLAVPAYAADEAETANEPVYAETHYQVNFEDVNVNIDGENIDVELIDKPSLLSEDSLNTTQEDVDLLNQALDENAEMKEALLNDLSSGEDTVAISVTEVPLLLVDGHYERVPVETYQNTYVSSSPNGKGKFTMYTTVDRSYSSTNGKYTYTTLTRGSWSENSAIGGSNYPASGLDFIMQSIPGTWVYTSRSMTALYNDNSSGVANTDFSQQGGGDNWTKWAIKDDPLGTRQNKSFTLTCKSAGPASSQYRTVGSYYVHTWATLTVSVTVNLGQRNNTTLSITPSIANKSWQVYNPVAFNF